MTDVLDFLKGTDPIAPGQRRMIATEIKRLRARNGQLRALLIEAVGHVAPDTGWSYDEPTGYLLDRIEAITDRLPPAQPRP